MRALVSICIPAFEQPLLLVEAVESCLAQTYGAIEVIVADDSRTDAVAAAMSGYSGDPRVRYVRNQRQPGQAENVNGLFELARGERLVLLHHDNLLESDAVSRLDRCWRKGRAVTAAYGKQYVITHSGERLRALSGSHNDRAHRLSGFAGFQSDPLWAALAGQFPADGYMVSRAAACAVKLRARHEIGDACDVDFGLRLAQAGGTFYFLDAYTSSYRVTDRSISNESVTMNGTFKVLQDLAVPQRLEPLREQLLMQFAKSAVRRYILIGARSVAWSVIRDPRNSMRVKLRAACPSNLLLLMLPVVLVRMLDSTRRRLRRVTRRHATGFRLREAMYRLTKPSAR